ncbi:glutathione S-transferase family protein [Halomonas campisalis]|uniref:Glutathione S-transferase family protein n=2 Tax=Billgrantia campisalis TaxID=74661 RepID=A0ABS9PDI1_9GAMM|nr:glutathione S-transferase family protein [Halomonas campisalis]
MVLERAGLGYRDVLVDRAGGGLDDPAFRRLNPQGLLPVLVDEHQGTALFETGAILLTLGERCHPERLAMATTRSALLAWLFFLSNTLHAELRLCFYTARFAPEPEAARALRGQVRLRLLKHLALLEAQADHGRGPWLLPEGESVLDPYLACLVRWLQLYPLDDPGPELPWERLPCLEALLKDLAAQPAIRRAASCEGITGRLFVAPDYPQLDLRAVTGRG